MKKYNKLIIYYLSVYVNINDIYFATKQFDYKNKLVVFLITCL